MLSLMLLRQDQIAIIRQSLSSKRNSTLISTFILLIDSEFAFTFRYRHTRS